MLRIHFVKDISRTCLAVALTHSMLMLAILSTTASAEDIVVNPKPAAGPLDNPLKGWCPFTDAGAIAMPYSMVYFNVSWKELEPQAGQYAFEKWERETWNVEAARGKHIIFRVTIDTPAHRSGIPQWIRDQGVKVTRYEDYGGGESPNYDDSKIIIGLEKLIAGLGKRYDNHPRIAFIQLGLLGYWGEWHTYPRKELFANAQTQRRIVDAYQKAFTKKLLMARYPGDYAGKQEWLGFHDDMFPEDTDGKEEWKFLPKIRESKRMENWKRAPIGGEMVPGQAIKWLGGGYDHTQKMIEDAKFSWVGPYCPALEQRTDKTFVDRASVLVRRMGYQFVLNEIRHSNKLAKGEKLSIAVKGENQGVAPFYYPWLVQLVMLDQQDAVVEKLDIDWDIRSWLPGQFEASAKLTSTAKPGHYRLGLGIIDPDTQRPRIEFANELKQHEGWTIFSEIDVR